MRVSAGTTITKNPAGGRAARRLAKGAINMLTTYEELGRFAAISAADTHDNQDLESLMLPNLQNLAYEVAVEAKASQKGDTDYAGSFDRMSPSETREFQRGYQDALFEIQGTVLKNALRFIQGIAELPLLECVIGLTPENLFQELLKRNGRLDRLIDKAREF